jgi:hypothetical protein
MPSLRGVALRALVTGRIAERLGQLFCNHRFARGALTSGKHEVSTGKKKRAKSKLLGQSIDVLDTRNNAALSSFWVGDQAGAKAGNTNF